MINEDKTDYSKDVVQSQANLTGTNKSILAFETIPDSLISILKENHCQVKVIKFESSERDDLNFEQGASQNKYDVILLGDLLENIKKPTNFLTSITRFLTNDGYLVFFIKNITHGSYRINFLNGNFFDSAKENSNSQIHYYTLDKILSLLESCGFTIRDMLRIKKDLFDNNDVTLVPYTIPQELMDAILFDPESTTYQYVISTIYISKNNKNLRKVLQDFPNTMTTEYLRNIMIYYKSSMKTE